MMLLAGGFEPPSGQRSLKQPPLSLSTLEAPPEAPGGAERRASDLPDSSTSSLRDALRVTQILARFWGQTNRDLATRYE